MAETKKIPYKIYLEEQEMPRAWYNVRADMKNKPAPLLNPGTLKPMTAEELGAVFCDELVSRNWTTTTPILKSRRRSLTSIRCTVPLLWCAPTAWRRNSRLRRRSIINSREIIQAEATS